MAPHRVNVNEYGHAHELTFSCYHRYPFFKAERTCQWLAEAINDARTKCDFLLWAYVFMPDHVHLIICPRQREHDISAIRKEIKTPVGRRAIAYMKTEAPQWLPRISRVRGGKEERLFWQSGGGYDRNITELATLLKMLEYIHNNPIRAGFVERAIDWKWSSASWYVDMSAVPLRVDPIPWEWLHSS